MIKQIDLKTACDTIYLFAEINQTDPLAGIELMVKYYKQLSQFEQQSLNVFMEETKHKTLG